MHSFLNAPRVNRGHPRKKKSKVTYHFFRFSRHGERRAANLRAVMDMSRVAKSLQFEAERQLTQTWCRCAGRRGNNSWMKGCFKMLESRERAENINCLFTCVLFFIFTHSASVWAHYGNVVILLCVTITHWLWILLLKVWLLLDGAFKRIVLRSDKELIARNKSREQWRKATHGVAGRYRLLRWGNGVLDCQDGLEFYFILFCRLLTTMRDSGTGGRARARESFWSHLHVPCLKVHENNFVCTRTYGRAWEPFAFHMFPPSVVLDWKF